MQDETAFSINAEPVPALVPHSSSPHDERASLLPSSDSEVVSIQQPPMTTKIRILRYTLACICLGIMIGSIDYM